MEDYGRLLNALKNEEETLQFREFTNEMALHIGLRLLEVASNERKSIAIDISRNGQQLFRFSMSGTSIDNNDWIRRKNNVVNRFGHSSYYMGNYYKSLETTMQEKSFLDPQEYSAFGGAFPIIIKNVGVVGTITVSGLPQKEDHELVVSVIKEFVNV